ncbi:MAG: hypothetical protein AB7J13_14720, partial [Pyrinomonadaceae bacterium]
MRESKICGAILGFGLLLALNLGVAGQIKVVSSAEFHESLSAANQKAAKFSRETIQIDETLVDGAVIKEVETTTRLALGVAVHSRTRTTENGSFTEEELIFTSENDSYYRRENGGAWKKEPDGGFRRMEILIGGQPFSLGQYVVDT